MGMVLMPGIAGGGHDLDIITATAGDVVAGKVIVDKDGNPLTGTLTLTGNAGPGDVLDGVTFYNTDPKTKRTGTLSLNGNAGTGDVRKGKTFYNTNAKSKQTGTMTEKSAATYTPGTANQVIAANQFLAGAQTILGDPDLVAGNILYGKNIFGVAGNVRKYARWAGTKQSGSATKYFEGDSSRTLPYIQFAPGFTPMHVTANLSTDARVYSYYTSYGQFCTPNASVRSTMTANDLIIPVPQANATYNVLVVGYY